MALTIPVSADTAVGGPIRPGDVVEVLVTTGRGTPQVHTAVVLPKVTVYDVGYQQGAVVSTGGSSSGTATGPISWVTLVVTQPQAIRLAQAKWAGQLDVALLAGQ
jgi:pilus assembly protein CpaB